MSKVRKSALNRLVLLSFLMMLVVGSAAHAEMTQKRQDELLYVLVQDCGSCHGSRLLGGLGPALLPEQLQNYDRTDIATIILDGRPGTPMPPWRPLLSVEEANWLADVLKSGDMVK